MQLSVVNLGPAAPPLNHLLPSPSSSSSPALWVVEHQALLSNSLNISALQPCCRALRLPTSLGASVQDPPGDRSHTGMQTGKVLATQSCPNLQPWTVARQAPLSMGFSRQEYWSGLPFPSQGDLPNQGLPHCRQILLPLSH